MEKKDKLLKRYLLFVIGLMIASFGVALSAKAGLGTSPVASIPYSVSLVLPVVSFGTWLNTLSIIQIATQCIILKGKVSKSEIAVQTILAFFFGYMTDFAGYVLKGIEPANYIMQFAFMILSCIVLGMGIWIQLKGGVAMLPGEALNRAIAQVSDKKYASIKILTDFLMIVISAIICLVFTGRLEGVREGSIIAAFAVGTFIKIYERLFRAFFTRSSYRQP